MAVLKLVPRSNVDTVRVLESLLNEAHRGEVTDVCLTFRRKAGAEDFAFSGVYRRDPGTALRATVLLKAALIAATIQLAGCAELLF